MIDNYTIFKLLKLNGVGNVAVNKILLELDGDLEEPKFKEVLLRKNLLKDWENLDDLEINNQYQNIINSNIHLMTGLSDKYPGQLRKTLKHSAPAILYYKGNQSLFNQPSIAVIGSRNASIEAVDETKKICGILSSNGFNIVSGYAKGIDRTAHISALNNEGTTSIVLPNGLNEFKIHKDINLSNKEIDWLVLSEFQCDSPWSGANAMTRNKTIIGLSSLVIVMESGPEKDTKGRKSGTFNSAQMAKKYEIPIAVLSPELVKAAGNKDIIDNGAVEIRSSDCLTVVKNNIKIFEDKPQSDLF